MTYNLLISLIGNLKVIAPMQLVSIDGKGGPLDSTVTVMLYLYNKGITGYEMGLRVRCGRNYNACNIAVRRASIKADGEGRRL